MKLYKDYKKLKKVGELGAKEQALGAKSVSQIIAAEDISLLQLQVYVV